MKNFFYKFLLKTQLPGIFFSVALLMTSYELFKETYFGGQLTLWESHAITIIVTALFASVAAFFMRNLANHLVKEAQEAQTKVQGVIKHIFDAVIMIDEHGIIETFNPAAEKIFGYNSEEVIGRNLKILMPEPYADEHDGYIHQYLTTKIPKILGKNRREVPGLRANGEIFPMDLITSEMRIDGRLLFIGVVRDITEYKRAEAEMDRLRAAETQLLENIQKELSVAAAIQMNMLPKCYYLFSQHPQIKAYGIMNPAKEIGGDFYDAFAVGAEHIVIAIGDVSGKGVPAALFMMETVTLLRSKINKPKKFATALFTINKLLCKNNESNMFVSLFVGLLNVVTGELNYVNGGHNPPLLARKNNPFELLKVPHNILLGIYDDAQYELAHTQLQEGDTLVLYTDGVTEAENNQQAFFSLERTIDTLASTASDVRTLVNTLSNEINEFCGIQPKSDDITIFALQYHPSLAMSDKDNFLEWSDNISVGVHEIDEQHKTLIDLINRLYDEVIVKDSDMEIIDETMNELVQYSKVHFRLEESLFHSFGYPETETHSEFHNEVKNKLMEIQGKSKQNNNAINYELFEFLKKWIHCHIAVEDKHAFDYLRAKFQNPESMLPDQAKSLFTNSDI